jgi:hypothetical protein
MKNIFSLLSLLLLAQICLAQFPSKKLDEKYGFREAKLESDVSAFTDLVLLEEGVNEKLYRRSSDELKVGQNDLKSIVYAFYKDKLATILIETKGLINSRALLLTVQEQYGKGYQPNSYIKTYHWKGNKAAMIYDENSASGDARLLLMSKPVSEQKKQDQKAAAKEAAKDF